MLFKKVYNYRARRRLPNQEQAKQVLTPVQLAPS